MRGMENMKNFLGTALLCLTCHAVAVTKDPTFLSISDVHYNSRGPVVAYGQGDTGDGLWVKTQAELQRLISTKKPQFILLLGDVNAHSVTNRFENIEKVLQDLRRNVHIPVYYVPGNNDSLVADYHSFSAAGKTPLSADPGQNWPTLNVSQNCATHPTAPCNLDVTSGAQFGYYSTKPVQGLRLIALNSVIFADHYVSDDGVSQEDATKKELDWFDEQLTEAGKYNQSAIIAMHIPPGIQDYNLKPMWQDFALKRFMNIMIAHSSGISGIYTSHTHNDEFRRLYDAGHQMVAMTISTPSISPIYFNNPAMRIFSYDPHNFKLTDVETDYTIPTASKQWNSYWFKADYDCKKTYIIDCVRALDVQDPAFIKRYKINYFVRNMSSESEKEVKLKRARASQAMNVSA